MTFASQEASQHTPSSNTSVERTAALAWTIHPGKRRLPDILRVIVCLLATAVCGAFVFHSTLLGLLPAGTLLFSVSEYWLPVHYTLDNRGASAKWGLMSLEIVWKDVRHAYLTDDGIKLSPLAIKGSRLEPLRGVFLRFSDNRDEVIEAVRSLRGRTSADG